MPMMGRGPNSRAEKNTVSNDALETILAYHQATKHALNRFADGPGYLDWATQPDPFRRYAGARPIELAHLPPGDEPDYAAGFSLGRVPPAPCDRESISRLFFDSLALSAWKEFQGQPVGAARQPIQRQPAPHRRLSALRPDARPDRRADRCALRAAGARPGGARRPAAGTVGDAGRRPAPRRVPGRADLDPLAGGVEVRPAGLSLLPARRGPCAGRARHRGRGPGLAGAAPRWAEHGSGRRAARRGRPARTRGGASRLPAGDLPRRSTGQCARRSRAFPSSPPRPSDASGSSPGRANRTPSAPATWLGNG